MQDSFGDGWNGADVEVYINGFFVKSMTIPNGYTATDSVLSYEGDIVDFYFNSGLWDHEITFDVYDPLGSLLGSYGTSPNTGNFLSHISNSSCCGSNLSLDPGNNRAICEGVQLKLGEVQLLITNWLILHIALVGLHHLILAIPQLQTPL